MLIKYVQSKVWYIYIYTLAVKGLTFIYANFGTIGNQNILTPTLVNIMKDIQTCWFLALATGHRRMALSVFWVLYLFCIRQVFVYYFE